MKKNEVGVQNHRIAQRKNTKFICVYIDIRHRFDTLELIDTRLISTDENNQGAFLMDDMNRSIPIEMQTLSSDRIRQLEEFKQWQTHHLTTLNSENSSEKTQPLKPYSFSGDWSQLKLTENIRDLRWADFRNLNLVGSDFSNANLTEARFDDANLTEAIFQNANLQKATFGAAELRDANLRNADLRDVDLSRTSGLTSESFGGANLQSVKLAEEQCDFKNLENVAEIAKYTQRIFQFLLLLCGFASLTILSMKDEDLIRHHGQSMTNLPILNAHISPINFAFVVPGLILIAYIYQFIYSISQWRLLSFLPAYFPDGTPLDRRAYPTILNTFIRFHLINVKNEPLDWLQCLVRGTIAFGVPPMTLAVFWMSCLRLHNPALSIYQSIAVGISVCLLLFVFALVGSVLGNKWGQELPSLGSVVNAWEYFLVFILFILTILTFQFLPEYISILIFFVLLVSLGWFLYTGIFRKHLFCSVVNLMGLGLITSIFLCLVSWNCFGSINPMLKVISLGKDLAGKPIKFPFINEQVTEKRVWGRDKSPNKVSKFVEVMSEFGFFPFIDIRNRVVSQRPENWTGRPEIEKDEMLAVSGADLENLDLRSMGAERAFLAKANCRNANLSGSYLRFANLREADLSGASLRYAYLRGASLRDANLQGTDLEFAMFSLDENDPTKRLGANFQGAKIDCSTKFDEVDLITSRVNNLALAYFGNPVIKTNDTAEQIDQKDRYQKKIQYLESQGLPSKTDEELNLRRLIGKKFAGVAMAGADFSGFDLTRSKFLGGPCGETDLSESLFIGADLTDVEFHGVNFQGANFTGAILNGTKFECCKLQGTIFLNAKAYHVEGLDEVKNFYGLKDNVSVDIK